MSLFYKVKNKKSGKTDVLTEKAKSIIENNRLLKMNYEVLAECDEFGRELNYNNFLNEINGRESIEPIKEEKIEAIGADKESESAGGNNGKTKRNKPRKDK
jgi:hypothetical protein